MAGVQTRGTAWGQFTAPSGSGSGSTGAAIVVANAQAIVDDYGGGGAAGTVYATEGFGTVWMSTGGGGFTRVGTPSVPDAESMPTAVAGETFSTGCVLTVDGVLTAVGDGSTGWTAQSIVATEPFDVTDYQVAGVLFNAELAMWSGNPERWIYSGAQLPAAWARVTTRGVPTLAALALLVPGSWEFFADNGDVSPALTVFCAETGFIYYWSGTAWDLP